MTPKTQDELLMAAGDLVAAISLFVPQEYIHLLKKPLRDVTEAITQADREQHTFQQPVVFSENRPA